jgi:hypothetical protein
MEAHTRQCRTPQLAPVVCQLTTQSGHAGKGGEHVHWRYAACDMIGVILPNYT